MESSEPAAGLANEYGAHGPVTSTRTPTRSEPPATGPRDRFGARGRVGASAPPPVAVVPLGEPCQRDRAEQQAEVAQRDVGMNLHLLRGMLHGLGEETLTAGLAPAPDRCCVRLDPAA
ncbi:hypothetical protein QFZ82_000749 [Streptomyces sp. V4I23]|nr:hypothetical protein [Streptomyces sp. V4I23]